MRSVRKGSAAGPRESGDPGPGLDARFRGHERSVRNYLAGMNQVRELFLGELLRGELQLHRILHDGVESDDCVRLDRGRRKNWSRVRFALPR